MDICQKAAAAKPPGPHRLDTARKVKKNQLPIYDTLGPFADETILSGIDRLAALFGVRRLQKFFNLSPPLCDDISDETSSDNYTQCPESHKLYRTCSTVITESSSPCSVTVTKRSCCSKCQSSASRVTTCTTKSAKCCSPISTGRNRVSNGVKFNDLPTISLPQQTSHCPRKSSGSTPLKRSFSLCSLACRKIRQKLAFDCSRNSCDTENWLWARMHCNAEGAQIYEVYKNSNVCTHPSQLKMRTSPKMIFIVLPSGVICPFETLPQHFK